MNKATSKLTVFFEDPFWVGVFERAEGERLQAAKVIFGAEPRDGEVYAFVLEHYDRLRFSPPVQAGPERQAQNPKRLRRALRRQLQQPGTGTRSQQALKLQQEQGREARKQASRAQRQAEEQRQFAQRQQKKKEKHRGR